MGAEREGYKGAARGRSYRWSVRYIDMYNGFLVVRSHLPVKEVQEGQEPVSQVCRHAQTHKVPNASPALEAGSTK